MKTFEHRATVKAARILRVDPRDRPFLPDLEGGAVEEMSFRTWEAAAKDVLAGNPLGYLVIHPNGLDGYVPKATFEAEFLEIRPQAETPAAIEPPPEKVTVHVTQVVTPIPLTPPSPKPAAPPAPTAIKTTATDRVLNLYADSLLTQRGIAEKLDVPIGSVAGFLSKARQRGDDRVRAGDKARLERAPSTSAAIPVPPRDGRAPMSATKPDPKPAAPAAPLPAPAKNAVSENARAASATRERVLEHYKATGDYETPMAQKLGVLRATIVTILTEAREVGDQRTRLGDIKRRAKERAK